MPDEPTGYYDEWHVWHSFRPPDYGLMGPHPSGSLRLPATAEQDAVQEAERIVAPKDTPPRPSAPSGPVVTPRSAVPAPSAPVDPLAAVRAYLRRLRTGLREDEP